MNIERVNQLHDEAMEFADKAILAKRNTQLDAAQQLTRRAFELEMEAAKLLENTDIEPSRSVLYRSAATLALECGEVREAERLIAAALLGNPPTEIANELRNLWKEFIVTMI